jgi:transposase
MRQTHLGGDRMFVDYAGDTVPVVVDRLRGEIREAHIFVAVMGASSLSFACASWTETLPDWVDAHVRAFDYFGGSARLLIPDNASRLVRTRTQLVNAIRGYAAEFGLIAPQGKCRIVPLLDRIAIDPTVPALARTLFAAYAKEYSQLQERIEEVEAELAVWHRANECSRRLAEIPGVGPIGASLLMMKTPAPELFASGRQFAAWMGLTPKDHSTGGKIRLGIITRAGDELLRSVLVAGATALLRHVRAGKGKNANPWLLELLKRKPPKLVAVAVANKIARIAWKLMMTGERYRANSISLRDVAA